MSKTIHFNTGRKYTAMGQRISATLHDDGIVTFYDHDRMIDGEYTPRINNRIDDSMVMGKYDRLEYKSTTRSREDGMYLGGCNTKYPE